jgi:hypothetical protein
VLTEAITMSLLNSHTARGVQGGHQRSARRNISGSSCPVRRVGYSAARVQRHVRHVVVKAVEEVGLCAGCRRSSSTCFLLAAAVQQQWISALVRSGLTLMHVSYRQNLDKAVGTPGLHAGANKRGPAPAAAQVHEVPLHSSN